MVDAEAHRGTSEPTAWLIDSDATLASLRASLISRPFTAREARIVLDPRQFDSDAREQEDRVNALYTDCGCELGALGLGLAVASLAAMTWLEPASVSWSSAVMGVAVVLGAALVGKAIGIGLSRIRLWRLLGRLERKQAERS